MVSVGAFGTLADFEPQLDQDEGALGILEVPAWRPPVNGWK